MSDALSKIAKALTAGLVVFYAFYTKDKLDGLTSDEWVEIAVNTLLAFGGVWLVPNAVTGLSLPSGTVGSSTTAKGGADGSETRKADQTGIPS